MYTSNVHRESIDLTLDSMH